MLASWAGWVRLTCRLTPPCLEAVRALVEAVKTGRNASAEQPETWNGLDRAWVAFKVEVSVDCSERAPQLVGLNMKEGRVTATWIERRRRGTPETIVGSAEATIARAV